MLSPSSARDLRERWLHVRERLSGAMRAAGRPLRDVTLVAVSKLHPAEAVAELAEAGQADFGENYVQEALGKQAALAIHAGLRWHCVGHVQSRKAKDVAGRFVLIHTVDSIRIAEALEKRLAAIGMRQAVLIQVNVGGEAQKSGVAVGGLSPLAEALMALPHLELQGLMCLPPVFDAGLEARPHFALLRELNEALRLRLGLPLPHLSMGMSGDFEAAVLEGATLVRIGSDIFGARPAGGTPGLT